MLYPRFLLAAGLLAVSGLLIGGAFAGGDRTVTPGKAIEKDKKAEPAKVGEKALEKPKAPDASEQLPSLQKVKELEDAYRKAREAALKDIDAAIAKAEAALAEANKALADKELYKKEKEMRHKAQEASRKASLEMQQLRNARFRVQMPNVNIPSPPIPPPPPREETRLAARFERPFELLVVQLKLEKGQGLVIADVQKDGPSAKAGIQANDVLIKIDGKSVPTDIKEFRKVLAEIKPDTAVTATVVRGGARETINDLKLPAAK